MILPCALCGEPLRTDQIGNYRKTTGWAEKRDAGGSNAIRLRKDLDEWAHGGCVDLEARGIGVNQETLGV